MPTEQYAEVFLSNLNTICCCLMLIHVGPKNAPLYCFTYNNKNSNSNCAKTTVCMLFIN